MNRDKTESLRSLEADAVHRLRVQIREFKIPPVQDALVLGRRASVGCHAIRKALHLLTAAPFVHIEIDDEVVSDLIVRDTVLRRFPRDRLVAFVLERIKPLMGEEEILHLEIETEIDLTAQTSDRHRDVFSNRA